LHDDEALKYCYQHWLWVWWSFMSAVPVVEDEADEAVETPLLANLGEWARSGSSSGQGQQQSENDDEAGAQMSDPVSCPYL
jgi:hypothetical protein